MPKKLQQYYIIKTTSTRLRNSNYSIELNLNQARENCEIVSMGESQLIRSLFLLQNRMNIEKQITTLFLEKKQIKHKKTSQENSQRLLEIGQEVDSLLFIPELVAVVIDNNAHYKHMIEQGFYINNRRYTRLLCGSGQSRRNTVLFIDQEWEERIKQVLNCGRNHKAEISPAKFNAYFALCSSATLPVSEPYFCVIPDYEVEREEEVEYVNEGENEDNVEKRRTSLKFSLFDGQGIISPRLARMWSNDLGLNYVPSTFIIRNAFLKGMVCVIDFHLFSDEIGKHLIKDVWGNEVNIRDMDLILTASQFKLWDSYGSCEDYLIKYRKYGFQWSISKYAPEIDTNHIFSTYQYLQVLNLSSDQIESLCKRTVEYFDKTLTSDINYTLLYLLGKNIDRETDLNLFEKTTDNISKAIMLDPRMLNDPYIHTHILRSLNKRIREAYIGNLLLEGNYQIMIADPYAFMQHLFNLPVTGLLQRNEHYSFYWNKKRIKNVVAFRPPLTWRSEVNTLDLRDSASMKTWYKYINSGIIYNIHGYDCMLHADSDMDGDIIMTTDQQELIDGAYGGKPISYSRNKVPRQIIDENTLYESDMKAFNTRIGFITNCSTTLYSMLNSPEYTDEDREEIIKRLKICRKEQGNQIDKSKGLYVKPFPSSWTKKIKIKETDSPDMIDKIEKNNRLVISKRPYFMRWLYPNYNRDYKKYREAKNIFCLGNFGCSLDKFLTRSPETYDEKEQWFFNVYLRNNPLLDTDCIVNKICKHMEKLVSEIKLKSGGKVDNNLVELIKGDLYIEDINNKLKLMEELYSKYQRHKQTLTSISDDGSEERYKTIEQYNKIVRNEAYRISSNINELASLAVAICYVSSTRKDKGFAWNIFGEGIVNNILRGKRVKIQVPFLDSEGDIEYLGNRYSLSEIEAGDGINDYIL